MGISWSVLDYDENDKAYEGFWNLSHHTRMDYTASLLPNFRLMPMEKNVGLRSETGTESAEGRYASGATASTTPNVVDVLAASPKNSGKH